jgi:hypothetical protein
VAQDDPRSGHDGCQRRAQVVADDAEELLAKMRRAREQVAFRLHFFPGKLFGGDVLEHHRDVRHRAMPFEQRKERRVDGDPVPLLDMDLPELARVVPGDGQPHYLAE